MKMKSLPVVVMASLVIFLTGCDRSGDQSGKTATKAQKVTVAQFGHVFLYLPLYVAKDKGFFKKEGLDINIVSTGGDEKTFAAVAGGSAQFGVADPTFTAIAREKGLGGKVVASLVNGVTFWGIAFDKDMAPITKVEGFVGKSVAVYTAPSTNYAVMKKILANNGQPVDAQLVQGAFGSLVSMLKAGKADIAMELEPVTSIAVKEGAHVVYSMVKAFGDFAFTGVTVSDQYLKSNPETVRAFVRALNNALKYVYDDFDGALAVATREFPDVPADVLKNALKRLLDEHTIPRNAVLSQAAWDKAIALRKEVGDLKAGGAYADNVDMSFAH